MRTWEQGYVGAHATSTGGRRRLFRPLPHARRCDCWKCCEIRDENQAVRLFMGWPQPGYKGGVPA